MVQGDDPPPLVGAGERLLEELALLDVVGLGGVETDEQHVAEIAGPPASGHPQGLHLGVAEAGLDVVVPEDREQLGPLVQDRVERAEHRLRKPGRVTVRVDVVAEQEQHVVGRLPARSGHRGRRRVQEPPLSPMSPMAASRSRGVGATGRGS
ncbi:MAG: hypothetical protein M5U14_05170 [Acidimicrobiia bacterium]|nr:hypothetical protein [Acidimicrobiia bacterium]